MSIALVLVILAELIGFARWTPIEKITILLVPFVHTIWLAVLFAPQAAGRWVKVYTISDSTWAAGIILVATYPLMVRYGTLVGPNVPKLMQAGCRPHPAGGRQLLGRHRHGHADRHHAGPEARGHRRLLLGGARA